MINTHTYPAFVGGDVINPVRNPLAQMLVNKILAAHLDRLPLGMPFVPCIFEIPNQCLFLGVHRYHRLPALLKRPDLLVDMLELRLAIGMCAAFLGLPIGLQAVVQLVEQPSNGVVTHVVPLVHQRIGKVTGALAGPQQRRLRVPTDGSLQQRLQILEQGTITLRHTAPPSATTTDPVRRGGLILLDTWGAPLHFSEPGSNGGAREPGGLSDCRDAAPPDGQRFASGPTAPHVFVHDRAQSLVFVPYCRYDLSVRHTGVGLPVPKSRASKRTCIEAHGISASHQSSQVFPGKTRAFLVKDRTTVA